MPAIKYTKEMFLETAKQFTYSSEFKQAYPKMYNAATKRGWLKDFEWSGGRRSEPIDVSFEECYNVAKKCTTVSEFKETGIYYTKALKNKWLKHFDWLKYKKAVCYTYEYFMEQAKQYNTVGEFKEKNPGLYSVGCRREWIKDCYWLGRKKTREPVYTHELCFETAAKYEYIRDFRRDNPGMYDAVLRNGWKKELDSVLQKRKPKYSFEEVRQVALKYETMTEFFNSKEDNKYYLFAKNHNWFDKFYWLKPADRKEAGYWQVYENNYNEAKKYDTLKDFREKNNAAYNAAREMGYLKDYTWLDRRLQNYWNVYENNRKEAMKFKTRTEFFKSNQAAYEWARKNGWLDTYDWFEKSIYSSGYTLSLLKSGDLEGMSRHQLIELIRSKKLPKEFKMLAYTNPNSDRRVGRISDLIAMLSGNHTDEENETEVERMESEERQEYENQNSHTIRDTGLLTLVIEQPGANTQPEPDRQVEPTLPTAVIHRFQMYDTGVLKMKPGDKAAEFIVAESLSNLWNSMLYANEDGKADEEFQRIKSMQCGEFSSYVRDKFVSQYEKVTSIQEDPDYRFDLDGTHCPPSLMQKLMAFAMSEHNSYGNWCGTGAGKTNAFLFSTRYICAKTNVVITPNGVIDTLVKAIRRIYPNSNIVVPKTPDDIKPYGKDQYTYIIFNYEKFQLGTSAKAYINRLFDTNTIDFVCLDEVQNIKVRDVKTASNRSKYINSFLVKGRELNPDMKTLAMTATPCPNSLSEVRSILEALTGKSYADIGNRTGVDNVHNAYKAMLLNGFRYVPKYPIMIKERVVEIDCSGDDELCTALMDRNNTISDIEQMLANCKLDALRDELRPGVITYSNWVDGMAKMLDENVRSWNFKSECYNGLSGDKEGRAEILERFIKGKLDVMVCSQPIGTGVDGLQKKCNKIVFISLPWTDSDLAQIKGRAYRQGSAFNEVEFVYLQVNITLPDGRVWSWDRMRREVIEDKRSLSSAVLDGYLQDTYNLSREHLKHLAIEALKSGLEENEEERPDIEVDVDLNETEEQRRVRRQNYVSGVHRLGNTSNHNTMHKYFEDHPEVFNTYHDSRDTEELAENTVKPVADFINAHYHDKKIADLGCGVNMLSTLVRNGNTVTGFDHQRYKDHDEVVIADIGNLNGIVKDGEFDIAVFCLSLWGQDYEDYFNEAFRILSKNGVVFVVEPTSKFGEDGKFGTEEDFIDMVEGYGFSRLGKVSKRNGFTFLRFVKEY